MSLPVPLVLGLLALLASSPTSALFEDASTGSNDCSKSQVLAALRQVMTKMQDDFEDDMANLLDSSVWDDNLPTAIGGDIKTLLAGVQVHVQQIAQAAAANGQDCGAIQLSGQRAEGEYTLRTRAGAEVRAWCRAGWTVIQRRVNGDNFHRNWNDYVAGFGARTGDHWLGLKQIYELTNPNARTLRFEMYLDVKYKDNSLHWSEHDKFQIGAADTYKVSMGSSRGNDDQYFRAFQTMQTGSFSANGKDQDGVYRVCTNDQHGGWWYRPSYNPRCASMNPNGKWNQAGWDGAWSNYWNGGCVTGSKIACSRGCTGGNNVCAYWHPWLLRTTLLLLK